MLTKNLTPFAFGTRVTSRRPPQPEMTLVVRGTFRLLADQPLQAVEDALERGNLTGDLFADDDREQECIQASDFADFKLRADLLLAGSCYAPYGREVTQCPVEWSVGDWSKALHVFGPRRWTMKGPSKPEPFAEMPLDYRHAFGGPGHDANPVGQGHKSDLLPTVELPKQLIATKLDRPPPAAFGPVHPEWPARAGKRGKEYGKRWLEERAPFYSVDFDWSYFSAAPTDQQLDGYLRGDEPLRFVNLHPTVPVLKSQLPGLRVRAFVKDVEGRFREVPMVLDTLFARPAEEMVYLTWRGVEEVRDDDLDDVATVLIASEGLADPPETADHYRAAVEAFEADPCGLEGQLPTELVELKERLDREEDEPPGEGLGNPLSNMLGAKLGSYALDMQDKVKAQVDAAKEKAGDRQSELDERLKEVVDQHDMDEPPSPTSHKPGEVVIYGLRRRMRGLLEQADSVRKQLDQEHLKEEDKEKIEAKVAEMEQIPHNPAWKQLDSDYEPPVEPLSTDEPGPGCDLSEHDLSRRDLRGVDLTGACLRETILTKANLSGVSLAGADLTKAILYKTDLSGADLSGADLTKANLASVRAAGARFRGAKLEQAFFEEATLEEADLSEAEGEWMIFSRANLQGAMLRRVKLSRTDFGAAKLDGADFTGADLSRCHFLETRAQRLDLTNAKLSKTTFDDADRR
ncbi:MAG: DUF2169 domain-containing protein, partial [Deltaproteobacteria bacterium]|nr:DUF2169 domain-containing protein [Deltaproteobacteria bacterium]